MKRFALTFLWFFATLGLAHADLSIPITYLKQVVPEPPVLSNLDAIPQDDGLAGARLGLADNLTTGGFLGHAYTLEEVVVAEGGDIRAAARDALSRSSLLVIDAPADLLLAVADLEEAAGALLLNAAAGDNALRAETCRPNVLHTLPSDAMRTDALAQFLVKKRWSNAAVVAGTTPLDIAFAASLETSMQKFGLRLMEQKTWAFDADMRRNAAQEVPVFTQDLGDYDVLIVIDEIHDFGRYIPYNTWLPRPIVGSEGLAPVAWSPVVEQWGAVQLQNRFEKAAARSMRPKDYAAWAAVRAIGEAVTRTNSGDETALRDYLLSDTFELAGFKGRPLSFRQWNGQLRQPIPLVQPRALVALAPIEGFLHRNTELDTLGQDEPESACTAFN